MSTKKPRSSSIAAQTARQNAMMVAFAKWSTSGLPFAALRGMEDSEIAKLPEVLQ